MLWIILKGKLQTQTNENHNWIEQTKVNKFERRIFVNSDTEVAVDKNEVFWDWIPAVVGWQVVYFFHAVLFFRPVWHNYTTARNLQYLKEDDNR